MTSTGHSTFNNQIVEALRQGGGDRVAALLSFGISPEKTIDLVYYSQSSTALVTTKSAWFWSHQSQKEDGVMVWWDWLDRHLETLPETRRASTLAKLFIEAMESSAPQESGRTITATWSRAMDWTCDDRAPGWTRQMMVSYLAGASAKLGNQSVNGLHALERNMLITRSDWSSEARQRYPQDPLSSAVSKVQVELVELLLDMGCDPVLQDGRPILGEAWAAFEAYFSVVQQQYSNEDDHSAFLVERLFARDLDWNVPSASEKGRTVAQDAEKWLDMLKVDPEKWDAVSRQIEARILAHKTAHELPIARAKAKPRL